MRPFFRRLLSLLSFLSAKVEINYLFFFFFWLIVIAFSFTYFFSQSQTDGEALLFFVPYTLGQALLEVAIFMSIGWGLKRWTPNWLFKLYIGVLFFALLGHYTDFILLRVLDSSFSYVIKFFFGSGIQHLFTAFLALNFDITMIGLILAAFLLVPFVGIGFYWITSWIIRQIPWRISLKGLIVSVACIGTALFLFDLIAYPHLSRIAYNKYQKALPLGTTFLPPAPLCYRLPKPLAPIRNEAEVAAHIETIEPLSGPLPNIYFFIIETLRRDFTSPDIAPNMATFAMRHPQLPHTYSNANSTNLSWYALLNSDLPFHWTGARDHWSGGSAALRVLKKLGYKIKVYSSADLRYFNMDQVLFGKNRQLVDQLEEYNPGGHLESCTRDKMAIQSFIRDLDQGTEGVVYLFFLDSTHSDYSFPKELCPFTPICEQISYLTITPNCPELDLLKNRYRNAVSYIDSLLGDFVTALEERGLYNDGIIAITGDHGEEFFEEGALFHGTHLNVYQTSVPLLCKFKTDRWTKWATSKTMTHTDILPSIIHYLTGQSDFSPLFAGESIFSKERWPYHISVLQNGHNTPIEFLIQKEDAKINARFLSVDQIYQDPSIEILHISEHSPLLGSETDLSDLFAPLIRESQQ